MISSSDYTRGSSLGKKVDCTKLNTKNFEDLIDGSRVIRACFDSVVSFDNVVDSTIINYYSKKILTSGVLILSKLSIFLIKETLLVYYI